MKNDKKDKLFEEGLRKFKYRVGYKINESARYNRLVDSGEQFDNLPTEIYNTEDGQPVPQSQSFTNEAGDQEDAPKPGGGAQPPAPSNDQPLGMAGEPPAGDVGAPGALPEPPAPAGGAPAPDAPADGGGKIEGEPPMADPNGMGADPMGADPMGMGGPDPGQQVDDIQNDIIKHNIEAMKSIHDQLQGLENSVNGLNAQLNKLNTDVEEVREPTNTEKLMSKTNVSYPYYFNLNDFWSGNWFNEKRKGENEKGIRELPDGSFIADFDDLPQKSKQDVQNSFNEFNESVSEKKNVLIENYHSDNNLLDRETIWNAIQTSAKYDPFYVTMVNFIKGLDDPNDFFTNLENQDFFDVKQLDKFLKKHY